MDCLQVELIYLHANIPTLAFRKESYEADSRRGSRGRDLRDHQSSARKDRNQSNTKRTMGHQASDSKLDEIRSYQLVEPKPYATRAATNSGAANLLSFSHESKSYSTEKHNSQKTPILSNFMADLELEPVSPDDESIGETFDDADLESNSKTTDYKSEVLRNEGQVRGCAEPLKPVVLDAEEVERRRKSRVPIELVDFGEAERHARTTNSTSSTGGSGGPSGVGVSGNVAGGRGIPYGEDEWRGGRRPDMRGYGAPKYAGPLNRPMLGPGYV